MVLQWERSHACCQILLEPESMHDESVSNYKFSINYASLSASVKYKTEICRK